jgi:hypothetical protein
MSEIKLSSQATPEQIANWKKKHGDIYAFETEGKVCYLRTPERKFLSAAAVVGKTDPLKYNEVLLNNCWLGGDEAIKTNDKYFLGISGKLSELIEIAEGELKKL